MSVLLKSSMFILTLAGGVLLKSLHICGKRTFSLISKLVLWVAIPCAVISGYSGFSMNLSMISMLLCGFGFNCLMMLAGYRLGNSRTERGTNMILYSGYNVGTFSLPYVQTFFSGSAVVATCVFDMTNALFCCGGAYSAALALHGESRRGNLSVFFRTLFRSFTFDFYLLMFAISLAGLKLPRQVVLLADQIAPFAGYLAMLMVGLGIEVQFDKKYGKAIEKILFVRYAINGACILALWLLPWISTEIREVLTMNLLAPMTVLSPPYLKKYGADVGLASAAISISTIVSVILLSLSIIVLS